MKKEMLYIFFALSISLFLTGIKCSIDWYIDTCKITTADDGTYQSCAVQGDCASQTTGSNVNCSTYTYNVINNTADCINTCCSSLNIVSDTLTAQQIQQCYDQAQYRYKIYVIKIVFIVLGIALLVALIIGIFVCGFVKNPYTGERIWVGCCCCKKVPNFENDRNALQSNDKLDKKENNQQNLQSIFQPHSNVKNNQSKF